MRTLTFPEVPTTSPEVLIRRETCTISPRRSILFKRALLLALTRIGVLDSAVHVEYVAGGPGRTRLGGEEEYGLRDVLRRHVHLQRVALLVKFLQFLRLYPVGLSPLRPPGGVPDPGPLQHRVGVDRVDPDALGSSLLGQTPGQVQLGGLRRGVSRCVLPGGYGILRGDEDEAPSHALLLDDPERLASDQERSEEHTSE